MTKRYILIAFAVISILQTKAQELEALPLFNMSQLTYEGAFRLSSGDYGPSSLNYSEGPIAYNSQNNSLFIVGHTHQQAIAEFPVPNLMKSHNLSDLIMVDSPLQVFTPVLNRTDGGNREGIDKIGGLLYVDQGGQGKLLVNGYEYYDAPGDNKQTTLIVENANSLATSPIGGYYSFDGGAGHTSGWLSPVPKTWQTAVGGTHITGQSSGIPIISRTSVGPSAFAFNMTDALNATGNIGTRLLLDFSLENPLHADLSNDSGVNKLWTHLSKANYGFIIPGTRTYMTLGNSGGHDSGVCYKCRQDNGNLCSGYCSSVATDYKQYYWLWDMKDLLAVRAGTLMPYDVRPYDYGIFNTPFQERGSKEIGGGSFDPSTGNLYLSVLKGDTEQGAYAQPPVIVVYQVNVEENDSDEEIVDLENPDESDEESEEPIDNEDPEEAEDLVDEENPEDTEEPVNNGEVDGSGEETEDPVDTLNTDETEEPIDNEDAAEGEEETEDPVDEANPDDTEEPVDVVNPDNTYEPISNENPKVTVDTIDSLEGPQLSIYPNPTSEVLFITGLEFASYIQITDVSGKIIRVITTVEPRAKIDFTGYPPGIYAVLIFNKATNALVLEKVLKRN